MKNLSRDIGAPTPRRNRRLEFKSSIGVKGSRGWDEKKMSGSLTGSLGAKTGSTKEAGGTCAGRGDVLPGRAQIPTSFFVLPIATQYPWNGDVGRRVAHTAASTDMCKGATGYVRFVWHVLITLWGCKSAKRN